MWGSIPRQAHGCQILLGQVPDSGCRYPTETDNLLATSGTPINTEGNEGSFQVIAALGTLGPDADKGSAEGLRMR